MFEDFAALLRRLIPHDTYYAHDDWDRRTENICEEDMLFGNGHAHCMSMILGSAGESIPVADDELCLGQWQRVLFIELDRERDRRWLVKVVGLTVSRRLTGLVSLGCDAGLATIDGVIYFSIPLFISIPPSSRSGAGAVGRPGRARAVPQRPLPAAAHRDLCRRCRGFGASSRR